MSHSATLNGPLAAVVGEGLADLAVEVPPVAEAREGVLARLPLDLSQQPALLGVGLAQRARQHLEFVVGVGQLDVLEPVDLALLVGLLDLEADAQRPELDVGVIVEELVLDAVVGLEVAERRGRSPRDSAISDSCRCARYTSVRAPISDGVGQRALERVGSRVVIAQLSVALGDVEQRRRLALAVVRLPLDRRLACSISSAERGSARSSCTAAIESSA
jgi:hypothetical protein